MHPDYLSVEDADLLLISALLEMGFRWNWLADDGKTPLAQPCDEPEVMEEISDREVVFIIEHISDGTKIPPQNTAA